MADSTCVECQEPLYMEIEPDSEAEDSKATTESEKVPDDVELTCGCHFHWECFMEGYTITQCPNCSKEISSLSSDGHQQVLCTVRSEGGEEKGFDILPAATEEAYLRTYPEERRGHAYLQFCREGDVDAIVQLIKDDQDADAEEGEDDFDIATYTGSTEELSGTGLHIAVKYGQEEVAWLLLAIASTLDWSKFPSVVLQAMEGLRLSKEDRRAGRDIRSQKDANWKTPKDVATELGGRWETWLRDGLLNP